MTNKILVVGASSKVGVELVPMLVARGEQVKAATRRPGEYRAVPGVEVTPFDYDVRTSMKPALDGVDRVFMLSKWTDLHPERVLSQFVEIALAAGVKTVVFMSALAVDKDPEVLLTLVEKRIAGTGMNYTFLHPNWLMQNFSRGFVSPTIRNISAVVVPAASGAVSFVDARDVAAVAVAALSDPAHAGQTYVLTGGQALTYGEVADVLSETVNRRITYQSSTDETFRDILTDRFGAEQSDYILKLFVFVRNGDMAPVEPTIETLLGRPPTTFAQFASDNAAVWR